MTWFTTTFNPQVPLAMTIVNDGSVDGHCAMGGVMGSLFDIVIQETKRYYPSSRCTIKPIEEIGSYNSTSGRYSGAIGELQSGSIDCSFIPVFYPIIDDTDIVEYTRPIVEDRMEICSFYNLTTNEHNHVKDILFMFDTIPMLL